MSLSSKREFPKAYRRCLQCYSCLGPRVQKQNAKCKVPWRENRAKHSSKRMEDMQRGNRNGLLVSKEIVYCLLITLTCSPKAELQRAQLNGIGRMHVKGDSGSRQTAMNDPGARQPSQMFLTWVRPDHNTGNSVPYSLRIVCGIVNVP